MSQQVRDVVRGRDGFYRVRRESLDPLEASSRRPSAIVSQRVPATEPKRPIITKDAGPSSPRLAHGGAQLEASYIVPASSGRHHHRHSSVNTSDRLSTKERDRERERERLYPGSRGLTASRPSTKYAGDDREYSYEYTTPKQQVLRDLAPPQPRVRSSSHSGGRPVSMINLDHRDRGYLKNDREMGPPPSRALDSVGRKGSLKQGSLDDSLAPSSVVSSRYSRDDRETTRYRDMPRSYASTRNDFVAYPPEQTRHSRQRQPTIEVEPPPRHQSIATESDSREPGRSHHRHHRNREPEDPKYADSRHDRHRRHDYDDGETRSKRRDAVEEDYHDRRREVDDQIERRPRRDVDLDDGKERRRRYSDRYEAERDRRYEIRDRDRHRPDQAGDHPAAGLVAAGGAATAAGLVADGVRRHHHRDEDEKVSKPSNVHREETDRPKNGPETDLSEGEEREERRRRRRREREIEDLSSRYDVDEREPLRIEAGPSSEHTLREQQSYERNPEGGRDPQQRRRKHRHRHRSPSESNDKREDDTISSDSEDSADPVARTPRVVSPPNDTAEAAPRPPPKGILKKPREKFPEEEQTIREGVAPLDAAKKGIPSEARWTRINRRLVNPEALEQEGIRFEEFPDYVIVLKVLSPEEISKYTKLTHEIRERRRLEHGSQGSVSGSGSGGQAEELPSSPDNSRS